MYKDWNLSLLMDNTGYIENSNEYTNKSMGKNEIFSFQISEKYTKLYFHIYFRNNFKENKYIKINPINDIKNSYTKKLQNITQVNL